jgi:hypothetical protein
MYMAEIQWIAFESFLRHKKARAGLEAGPRDLVLLFFSLNSQHATFVTF